MAQYKPELVDILVIGNTGQWSITGRSVNRYFDEQRLGDFVDQLSINQLRFRPSGSCIIDKDQSIGLDRIDKEKDTISAELRFNAELGATLVRDH